MNCRSIVESAQMTSKPGVDVNLTADAMHIQRETARFRVEADSLFIAKNQKSIREDIAALGHDDFSPCRDTQCDKAHGRLETRTIQLSSALNGHLDFPYVGQVFRLTRERIDLPGGKPELEVLYGLTSLSSQQAGARKLLGPRGPSRTAPTGCRIWLRMKTARQIRRRNGPRVMATLRHFAIGRLRLAGYPNITPALPLGG